jgi:hypothetical protein
MVLNFRFNSLSFCHSLVTANAAFGRGWAPELCVAKSVKHRGTNARKSLSVNTALSLLFSQLLSVELTDPLNKRREHTGGLTFSLLSPTA